MNVARYAQSHVRLQRVGDEEFTSGLVGKINEAELWIKSFSAVSAGPGDEFVALLFGPGVTTVVMLSLTGMQEDLLGFAVLSPPTELIANDNARVHVSGVTGTLTTGAGQISRVVVMDVSKGGAGLLTQAELEIGTPVTLELDGPVGLIHAEGDVRYCRPEAAIEDYRRIGVKIGPLERIDLARWNLLLSSKRLKAR